MPLRMFHLVPEVNDKLHTTADRYRLSDPELIAQVLPAHNAVVNEASMLRRLDGLIKVSEVMKVDIVVVSPPESYRALLELMLTQSGLIVAYDDYAVLEDGSLFKVGYRLAHRVPTEPKPGNVQRCYADWVANVLSTVDESERWKVVDPWITYLQHELRAHYQHERGKVH